MNDVVLEWSIPYVMPRKKRVLKAVLFSAMVVLLADAVLFYPVLLLSLIHICVRNLERRVGDICRKSARELLEQKKNSIRITEKNLDKYLGREKVLYEDANEQDQVGIVRGLAWTSVGGDTLQIEVNVMPGKGNLQMTGNLGDVMKELSLIHI